MWEKGGQSIKKFKFVKFIIIEDVNIFFTYLYIKTVANRSKERKLTILRFYGPEIHNLMPWISQYDPNYNAIDKWSQTNKIYLQFLNILWAVNDLFDTGIVISTHFWHILAIFMNKNPSNRLYKVQRMIKLDSNRISGRINYYKYYNFELKTSSRHVGR